MKFVLTCEHAVPDIPELYQQLFAREQAILETHEAYDPGAFDLFIFLEDLANYSKSQIVGRLLVETNRSLRNSKLFSRFSSVLDDPEKKDILNSYYHPYRARVEEKIRTYTDLNEMVLHLSIHSFTPVLNKITRNCDIGLLYDPKRINEKQFCADFKEELLLHIPELKIRFNYPYLGKADGFTTHLRKIFPENYMGIEMEVNQAWVSENVMDSGIKEVIRTGLEKLIQNKSLLK